MRIIIYTLLIFQILISTVFGQKSSALNKTEYMYLSDSIKQQLQTIRNLETKVAEIKRDQLNYQIEKDLLKETYSTNYNSINSIISIGLLFITILGALFGYIGFKNIAEIRKEYKHELAELTKTKAQFDARLKAITKREAEVNAKIQIIEKQNSVQNEKIKLLEIKEKISGLIKKSNFDRALDYIAIGLEMVDDDLELLQQKVFCYTRNEKFKPAIETNKLIVSIEKKNDDILDYGSQQNLAELFLFVKDFRSYKLLIDEIKDKSEKTVLFFLDALHYYILNDKDNFLKIIDTHISHKEITKDTIEISWDLTDAREFSKKNKNDLFNLFNSYLKMLGGEIEIESFTEMLSSFKQRT